MKREVELALEIVDIRQFEARDFTSLLEAESQAWGTDLRWDYTASARLIASCLAEKRLSGYALVNERRIQGYSFFLYEGEKGLIGDLFVEPNGQTRQQALLLLEHVIETLMGTPGLRRVEAQLPHFSLEELETCFAGHRFDIYLRKFMALTLARRSPHTRRFAGQFPSGDEAIRFGTDFSIEPWDRKRDLQAAQLLYRTYRNHIDAIINDQYRSVTGAARLIENIVHLRGCGEHLPQASLVAIHRATGKLAGTLALTAVRPGTAHIPQVAVAEQFQGRGLGTFLLESSFDELDRQGYQEVSLTVTGLNAGAVRLYERLGFETFRTFGAFVWNR